MTMLLGELKQSQLKKQHQLRGAGLLQWLRTGNWFTDYSTKAKAVLQQYGDKKIHSLTIYRTPIQYDNALNALSLGRWKKLKQKHGYDKFFHLALIADVGSKNIIIEKNEIINISTSYETTSETETMNIPLHTDLTINAMLEKTREAMKDRRYFSYDAFENNCQKYIKSILEENRLYNTDIDKFLYQNVDEFKKDLPSFVKQLANVITGTASVIGDAVN
jgi:hypothetical protein